MVKPKLNHLENRGRGIRAIVAVAITLIVTFIWPVKAELCGEQGSGFRCPEINNEYSSEEAFRIGINYSTGAGGIQDSAKASQWMRRAAEQGHLYAQFNLGEAFINGYGVEQNDLEGVHWLKRAANGGLADAQVSLGLKYDEGVGVAQNAVTAVRWFMAAARQGNRDGQNNLAIAYAMGEGITQDNVQAYIWFERARLAGHPLSGEYLGKVASEMSAGEILEAQTAIAEMSLEDKTRSEAQPN
ncbi:MAG: sel1 repeat family protein [Gammaproteobacteria bacterium]|nr:sel1 repeat family protein [Gammaproteobacteria bacterium]